MSDPITNYLAWINRAIGARDNLGSTKLYDDNIDWGTPQLKESGLSAANRPPEVRAQPEPIWPPQSWWDQRGVMPSTQDRIGSAQAFAAKAADFFGIPSALLSRFAPQAEKTVNALAVSHPTANMAGNVAGVFGSFAPVRAAGNALAARGHGRIAQSAADAGTLIGLGTASDVIRDGTPFGMTSQVATQMAPVAVLQRAFMPNMPSSVVARAAIGAGVGALPGLPYLATGNWQKMAQEATLGGLMAAAGRPSVNLPSAQRSRDQTSHIDMRKNVRLAAMLPASILGGIASAGVAYDYLKPEPPLSTPGASEWDMWRHQEPMSYPPPSPVFPSDVAYAEPSYPPLSRYAVARELMR